MALADDKRNRPIRNPPSAQPRERVGWLAKFAPGVRNLVGRRQTPGNLWVKSPDTGEMLYRPDLEAALWVTPSGHHMRIAPQQRFAYTFDGGRYSDLPTPQTRDDPLSWVYGKSYKDGLAGARKATGDRDSITVATGEIGGVPTVVGVVNFGFVAGSLGVAAGEAFVAAADEAVKRSAPLVVFPAGGGARMQESALALMQMVRTTIAVERVRRARLPYVVVLTDPTTGGTLASYAMLGDVHLAEPGALVGFSGRRVIEQTIRETLPAGFQTAEFLAEHGMVDQVVPRAELPAVLGSILRTLMLGRQRLSA
jgi:acetyl-CoA carboxylase carboxyl transferase subunit beta